jgi:hypothetical protein
MIQFQRTSKMEPTALLLDSRFDRVMVRAAAELSAPIRLRVKMMEPIRPFILRNGEAFDAELARWQKENGTLVNNRRHRSDEPVMRHNATLLCECPMSWDDVQAMSRDASELCVLYKPPSWRQHESAVHAWWPSGTACRQFADALQSAPVTEQHAAISDACGIPGLGTSVMDDDALCAALRIGYDELHCLRKRTMRVVDSRKKYSHRFSVVQQLIPRIEPEDLTLLPLYRAVCELPSVGHIRLARDNALAAVHRFWKQSLRSLVRSGCVERKPTLGYYFFDGPEPDYERIQAEHTAAKSKFTRMVAQVDALEEYR